MSSNPFNFNNWLGHDGDGGTATKDEFQIGTNNRIHSPLDFNPTSNTDLGATIISVRTPQNAALAGINACITDSGIGVYGESVPGGGSLNMGWWAHATPVGALLESPPLRPSMLVVCFSLARLVLSVWERT
jgi:hypothetical protein